MLVADEVLGYIVDIAGATRHSPSLQLGVSPRGATALLATARSWAWLSGRNYVTPDDVKAMARPTLRHRIALRPEAELEGANPDGVLDGILACRSGAALVVLTGRAGLVALICVLPIALSPWPATAFVVLLAASGRCVAVDVALAASTRRLRFSRLGDTAARLGQPVDAVLVVDNAGRRRFRGQIRDAWAPSGPRRAAHARASTSLPDNRFASSAGCGRCAAATSTPRWSPPARSGRSGLAGQAELAPGAVAGPDPAAVPVAQAPAVAAGEAA